MMLTIDEAIKHCEEVAEKQEITAKSNLMEIDKIKADGILRLYDADEYEKYMKCATEYRQLAEWLRELKTYRETMIYLFTNVVNGGYLLHKWTDEFGYVIQVTDVISAFEEVKDIQNANIKRDGKKNERKTESKEIQKGNKHASI